MFCLCLCTMRTAARYREPIRSTAIGRNAITKSQRGMTTSSHSPYTRLRMRMFRLPHCSTRYNSRHQDEGVALRPHGMAAIITWKTAQQPTSVTQRSAAQELGKIELQLRRQKKKKPLTAERPRSAAAILARAAQFIHSFALHARVSCTSMIQWIAKSFRTTQTSFEIWRSSTTKGVVRKLFATYCMYISVRACVCGRGYVLRIARSLAQS